MRQTNWLTSADARKSAAAKRVIRFQRGLPVSDLGYERTHQLVMEFACPLWMNPDEWNKLEWISHLGSRIIGVFAGKRFELR